jgi:tetratricopeptide (TPR) repeat protein
MRTVQPSILIFIIAVRGICAAQTPTETGQDAAIPERSGQQPKGVLPQIVFSAPRAEYQKLPASSSAPQAVQAADGVDPEVAEVTVTAQRSIPLRERARFYVEEHSASYDDTATYNMINESMVVCADEKLAIAKRIPTCDTPILAAAHGTSVDPTNLARTYVSRGTMLHQIGEDSAAVKDFNAAARLDPTSPRPWISLGNFYVEKGDFSLALKNFDRAIDVQPNPVSYDNRGSVLESLGRHAEAIADFSQAIAIAPLDTDAYSNRATSYLASKRWDLAIADLNRVISVEPSNHLAYYNRGMAYERSGDAEKAIVDYREAARRRPSFAPASAALGRLDTKDPQLALEELSTAIRIDAKSPAVKTRALLYLSLDKAQLAMTDLNQVLANDSSDANAWADRGVAKSQLGDFPGAVADCTRAIELAPTDANYVNRGNALATLHREKEALADFDAVLQHDPHNLAALIGRANADYAIPRLAASLDDYNLVIETDPTNAAAYFKRGNVHFDLKQLSAAYNDYSESLKLNPNQPVVLLNRSNTAARLGRRGDAAKDERSALELDPYILSDKR